MQIGKQSLNVKYGEWGFIVNHIRSHLRGLCLHHLGLTVLAELQEVDVNMTLILCRKASVEKKTVFQGTITMHLLFRWGQRLLNPEKMSDR